MSYPMNSAAGGGSPFTFPGALPFAFSGALSRSQGEQMERALLFQEEPVPAGWRFLSTDRETLLIEVEVQRAPALGGMQDFRWRRLNLLPQVAPPYVVNWAKTGPWVEACAGWQQVRAWFGERVDLATLDPVELERRRCPPEEK